MHTQTPSVTIQGNITAMRYRNDVFRSVLLLYVHSNLEAHLSNDCSKQRANTQAACKKSGFKSYQPLVRPIITQGSCTATATKSQEAHTCYSSDVCGHFTTVYS